MEPHKSRDSVLQHWANETLRRSKAVCALAWGELFQPRRCQTPSSLSSAWRTSSSAVYPSPGHPHTIAAPAWSRGLWRPCPSPRAGAGSRGFLLDTGRDRLLCQRQPQPRALRQPLPQKAAGERCPGQHFWRRLVFRGKSSDLVRPKHNKGWDLQLPDPSATFLQPFCLCYKRITKETELYPSLK